MFKISRNLISRRDLSLQFHSIFNKKGITSLCGIVDIHPEIKDALHTSKQPIVALESTIITHGMPYPHNLQTALDVEEIVRNEGSIPATIGILNGRIKIGLTANEIDFLAKSKKNIKCSRRDLAYVVSHKLCGGTTVAGTLIISNMVGIKIFATGGIGGVHRDGHITFDISADLVELGKTPIAVISSGIKSILDIPRTLEYLETQGVCVASYQKTDYDFPAFYTRSSGSKVPYNLNNPSEAAALIQNSISLKLNSGILIGVPIPEEHATDEKVIRDAIEHALGEAKKKNINGKEVTPFVLEAVSEITKGKSLTSNMALIKNNAKVASQIASELNKIMTNSKEDTDFNQRKTDEQKRRNFTNSNKNIPVVIGGSILDMCQTVKDDFKLDGATYEVSTKSSGGGVGRNLAEGIFKLYGDVNFISVVGNDDIGKKLNRLLPEKSTQGVSLMTGFSTSICNVIFDKSGECKVIFGDMEIHDNITSEIIIKNEYLLASSPIIIMDSNVPLDTMGTILEISKKYNKPVFFEPTDMRRAHKPFRLPRELSKQIRFISPNIEEASEIAKVFIESSETDPSIADIFKSKDIIIEKSKEILRIIQNEFDCVLLTLGEHGVIVNGPNDTDKFFDSDKNYSLKKENIKQSLHYQVPKLKKIVNVSGAGDSLTSGFISAMLKGNDITNCVNLGFFAARQALQSDSAVPKKYFASTKEYVKVSFANNITL